MDVSIRLRRGRKSVSETRRSQRPAFPGRSGGERQSSGAGQERSRTRDRECSLSRSRWLSASAAVLPALGDRLKGL